MKKSSVDLTQGNIVKLIVSFALPILIGQIFQNLYNSVDSIVVGRYVGTTALAAVTSCSDISHLLVGFFTGLATGAGVLFSRFYGAKNYERLHDAIHTAVLFAVILGVFMAALGVVLTPVLLRVVSCPQDVYPEASLYLRIYFVGILFTAIYNVGSGVLRAVGDSRNPLYYLIVASCTNIVLDLLFVKWLRLGVSGVALATIVSQCLSVVLVFRKMIKTHDVYRLVIRDLKIDKELLLQVMNLGLPAAIQTSLIAISNLFVQRYVNEFGSSAMAGIGAAKKIDKFVGMIAQSLGLAITTFVSQNIGAQKIRRAFQGIRLCLVMAFGGIAVPGVIIYFFAPFFVRIFTDSTDAISYGVSMITTMVPLYYFQSLNQVFSNAVRGFGKSKAVMVLSLVGMIGCRQLWLYLSMGVNHTVTNVYIGFPLGWFFSAVFVMIYYFLAIRRNYRNLGNES